LNISIYLRAIESKEPPVEKPEPIFKRVHAIRMSYCSAEPPVIPGTIFSFLLTHLGYGNVKIMFRNVYTGYVSLVKKWNNNGFGYFASFQYHLGKALITHGTKMARGEQKNLRTSSSRRRRRWRW
jgi:hypothetical protein